ncbi:hypothetical protein, conserved [Eimeria brunetti]|uniref:Uncharacterized protein n=1 Tax=Eimeria brunetti TaxID=51314 RepID=U6LHE0_9EIME|nr:hypothetical protein, conserved [Eimeria brunetti]
MSEGLGLALDAATTSLGFFNEVHIRPPGGLDGGTTHDLSTLEAIDASAVPAWRETESEWGRGRYSTSVKVSLILSLALCAFFSLGSAAWGRGRESIVLDPAHLGSFDLDSSFPRNRRAEELEEGLRKALVGFMQRPEHHEFSLTGTGGGDTQVQRGGVQSSSVDALPSTAPLHPTEGAKGSGVALALPSASGSGFGPGDDAAAAPLPRALDALHSASASTQRCMADKYLKELLCDSEDHSPDQLLEDMVRGVQAVALSEGSGPGEAEAQRARTALLVAVLDAFTARVRSLEHLGRMEAAAADEEARLAAESPVERVGLDYILKGLDGASEEAAESTAQQVESIDASVSKFQARRLLNYIQLSRQKLAGDLEVAAALLGPLNAGKDGTLRRILEPLDSPAVSLMQQHTSWKGREGVMIKVELEEYKLVRDMMKFLEVKGQGKAFLAKASNALCALYRLDRACRSGASQRAGFGEFLRDHWSAEAHDKLYELLEAQTQKAEKCKLRSRSYLVSSASNFLSSNAPKVKEVDVLLLKAAVALL